MWNDLPLIQKEITENLITNFELNQKDVTEKLGRAPAAVCQCLSHKRGNMKTRNLELVKKNQHLRRPHP
jgi:predicted transcriptional regulator